jgi:hypothetical protein
LAVGVIGSAGIIKLFQTAVNKDDILAKFTKVDFRAIDFKIYIRNRG